ncbi:exonuclease II Exo2 [Coemansia spiralis]|uniref:Exonuclease II Exo2 n=1 Tax=Coemansia spiralis TaxID=417178 RepID=A0A9W8L6Q4_9FUNG|nr:exonuclease II Exo2 [Coemansia spiralis]
MGVPGLFRWLLKRFPVACWTSTRIELTGTQSLFVDLNSTLHHGARQSQGDFQAIATAVSDLVDLIRPSQLLYLAIDGVPPRMKERLQRERRERLATAPTTSFNSYSITPGTQWMRRVEAYLCEFIENKRKSDANWRYLSVVFSGCLDPGEGEQKIMEYLRIRGEDGKHCVWSNDADSVLLSLATRVPHITIVSERAKSGIPHYTVFDIDVLREQIATRYASLLTGPGEESKLARIERLYGLVDDLVFMTLFAGNDFLPPMSFVIEWLTEPDFIDSLWAMYGHLPAKHQCLHNRGLINPRAFCELLRVFAVEGEERSFRKHVGVTALGSQLTALRIRRMEWDLQRQPTKEEDEVTPTPADDEHAAKRKKGRAKKGRVPLVWSGSASELAGTQSTDIAQLVGSAPLESDAKLGFLTNDTSGGSLLALDGRPLLSPTLVSSYNMMTDLAGSPSILEVHGNISSNKLKWLQALAKAVHLECTVRNSSDPKFASECRRWKRKRYQTPGPKESTSMIVIGDLDLCLPTFIISLRARSDPTNPFQDISVVSEDDWDVLYGDARTERRRDVELAEWRQGFYRRHYREKSASFIRHLCTHYADALGWTTMYYFGGNVSSWEFAWPDDIAMHSGVAPLASDLLEFLDPKMAHWQYLPVSDQLAPLAREHMLCIMPKHSWPLLTEEERGLAVYLLDNGYSESARQEVHGKLARTDNVPVVRVWI